MIITIDTCDNGCVVSYSNLSTSPMIIPSSNQVRVIKTDAEAVTEVETILSNLRAGT